MIYNKNIEYLIHIYIWYDNWVAVTEMKVHPVLFFLEYHRLTIYSMTRVKIELYNVVSDYLTNECAKMIGRFTTKI